MAAFNKFNQTIDDIADGVHNLGADTFKVVLTLTAPVATNSVLSDLTQIAAGNGYTTDGETLTITSSSQTGGNYTWVAGSSPVWTATGGAIADFRYAAIYNFTAIGKNLIGYYDYGSTVSLADGETFTFNANGVTLISGTLSAV